MTTTLPWPVIYADFTTEGGTNQYFYNGVQYGSASALITALGGSFTRSSTAYYTNSSGNLASAANNVLRFDYDPALLTSRGILLEGGSTNELLQSNGFTTTWSKSTNSTLSQNITGPDGVSNSAWTLTAGNDGFSQNQQSVTVSGTTHTLSIWFKAGTAAYVFIGINDAGGLTAVSFKVSSATIGTLNWTQASPTGSFSNAFVTPYSNGWYRIGATWGGSTPTSVRFGIADADATINVTSGKTALFSDAQLEPQSFASSYIPTTTGTVSRSGDIFSFPWTNSTASFYAKTKNMLSDGRLVSLDSADPVFYLTSNTLATNDGVALQTPITYSALNQMAVSGSLTSRFLDLNGAAVLGDGNALISSAPTTAYIFANSSDNSASYGNLFQLGLWNIALAPDQLQGLTGGNPFTFAYGPLIATTLTRTPAKAFTKKHYYNLLEDIRQEALERIAEERAEEEAREREAQLGRWAAEDRQKQFRERSERRRRDRDAKLNDRIASAAGMRAFSDNRSVHSLNDRLRHLDILFDTFKR